MQAGVAPPALVSVLEAGLVRVQPRALLRECLRVEGREIVAAGERLSLPGGGRPVRVLAVGKPAYALAAAAAERLEGVPHEVLVVTKHGHAEGAAPPTWRIVESAHPVPDATSAAAGRAIAEWVAGSRPDDLLLVLWSGGSSSLAVLPRTGVALEDLSRLTQALLRSGAPIEEMNAVRKHLDALKGGGLARLAAPSRIAGLVLSDVVGDFLDVIGSGPLVPDRSTFADAREILRRRLGAGAAEHASVEALLERGVRGEEPETLEEGDPLLRSVRCTIVGNGPMAVDASAAEAQRLGWTPLVLSTSLQGEAREVAQVIAAIVREILDRSRPAPAPCAILWGGETTVTVRGKGRGGRNQEIAAALALALEGRSGWSAGCIGTDGTDGPTDAAGGWADGSTAARAAAAGRSLRAALAENDVHPALGAADALLITGPTGTHVNDLGVVLLGAPR